LQQEQVLDILYIAAFFLGAFGFAIGPFLISHFLAPRTIRPKTLQIYECGMEPIGPAWIRFGIVYYLYALIFVAFDVDVLYLFPVALAYNTGLGMRELVEIIIFVGILSCALVYAWRKGVFKWEQRTYSRP